MNVMPVDIRVPPGCSASHNNHMLLSLKDKAIAVWLDWLVTVHRPRRIAAVQERRIRRARANAVISAGYRHSLALRDDGSVACWGWNKHGRAPPAGMEGDFVAVAAGNDHSLALQADGSVACWGRNGDGQAPPAGVEGDFVAVAAGSAHSLALRADGSVACWGANTFGQAPTDASRLGELNGTRFMTEVRIL